MSGAQREGVGVRPGTVAVDRQAVVDTVWLLEASNDVAGLEALAYVFADTELCDFVARAWLQARDKRGAAV